MGPDRTLSDDLELFAVEPNRYVMGRYLNVTLIYWIAQATGPAVDQLQDFTRGVAQRFPSGFSNIQLVKEGAPLPDSQARSGFGAMMDEHAKQMACVAVVLMGGGFWASALQGVGTGLRMLSPRTFQMRFVRSPDELRPWFCFEHTQKTRVFVDHGRLSNAIERVFQAAVAPASLQGSMSS